MSFITYFYQISLSSVTKQCCTGQSFYQNKGCSNFILTLRVINYFSRFFIHNLPQNLSKKASNIPFQVLFHILTSKATRKDLLVADGFLLFFQPFSNFFS